VGTTRFDIFQDSFFFEGVLAFVASVRFLEYPQGKWASQARRRSLDDDIIIRVIGIACIVRSVIPTPARARPLDGIVL